MKRKRVVEVEDEHPKKKAKKFDEVEEIFFILQQANKIFERSEKVEKKKIKLIPYPVVKPKIVQRQQRTPSIPPSKKRQSVMKPRHRLDFKPRITFSSNVTSYYLCDCGRFWAHKFTHPTRNCRLCRKIVELLFSSTTWIWVPHQCKSCNSKWRSTELVVKNSYCNSCKRNTKTNADWLNELIGLTDEYVVTKKYFKVLPDENSNDELEKIKLKIMERIQSIKKKYQCKK